MKNFKVLVHNHKAEFFKELLRCLDFVEFEEVESFSEPRIYPGANFEIRPSAGANASQAAMLLSDKVSGKTAALSNEEKMENLRKALRQIDEQRSKNRDR
jgi:hypothetical protein